MIEIVEDLPFEDCEKCNCFLPGLKHWIYADDMCHKNKVIIYCSKSETCKDVRRHIKNVEEEQQDAAE